MSNKLNFYVQETPSGEIILNDPDGGLDGNASGHVKVFKTRKELAEYINPQVATPAASAEDSHSKSKAWINEIDKAYGDHPKMNINAANIAGLLANKPFSMQNNAFNANDYLAGAQFNCSPYPASNPKQYDCNNCKGIKNLHGSCGCISAQSGYNTDMGAQARMASVEAELANKRAVEDAIKVINKYCSDCTEAGIKHQIAVDKDRAELAVAEAEFRKLVPAWNDPAVAKEEGAQIGEYGKAIGVDLYYMRDPVALHGYYKAWKHYEAAKKTAEVVAYDK